VHSCSTPLLSDLLDLSYPKRQLRVCRRSGYLLLVDWLAGAHAVNAVLLSPGVEGLAAPHDVLPGGQGGRPGFVDPAYPGGLPPWRLAEGEDSRIAANQVLRVRGSVCQRNEYR
jgi:hypothetical protein